MLDHLNKLSNSQKMKDEMNIQLPRACFRNNVLKWLETFQRKCLSFDNSPPVDKNVLEKGFPINIFMFLFLS